MKKEKTFHNFLYEKKTMFRFHTSPNDF